VNPSETPPLVLGTTTVIAAVARKENFHAIE
jgi:hypothetical protein